MNVLYEAFLLLKLEMCVQDIISIIQDLHSFYLKVMSH